MIGTMIITSIMVLLLQVAAFADSLVIIKGKDTEVCQKHMENLKTLSLTEMVCDREKYPNAGGIRRPKWEKKEIKDSKELVIKIEKFLEYGDQYSKWDVLDDDVRFESYVNNILKSNYLSVTFFDIDNDDKEERICVYSEGRCMYSHVYARPLLILDKTRNLIDIKKTEPVMQNPFGNLYDIKGKTANHIYQLYDVFMYKNVKYFDKWNIVDWTLTVYYLSSGTVEEVCTYMYVNDGEKTK